MVIKNWYPRPGVCPGCGRCDRCGRGNHPGWYWPHYPYGPYWTGNSNHYYDGHQYTAGVTSLTATIPDTITVSV